VALEEIGIPPTDANEDLSADGSANSFWSDLVGFIQVVTGGGACGDDLRVIAARSVFVWPLLRSGLFDTLRGS
jgi:hypothetical protein